MSRTAESAAIVERAVRYVRHVREALSDVYDAPDPRFTIHYVGHPGSGTGGTAGVTGDAAVWYLNGLLSPADRLTGRYGIKSITVRFDVTDSTFVF